MNRIVPGILFLLACALQLAAWEKPFPAPRWTEGEYWNEIHLKDHTGPPVHQGSITIPAVDVEWFTE